MKFVKGLAVLVLFMNQLAFADVQIFEAQGKHVIVRLNKAYELTIYSTWVYGNKPGHAVGSTLSRPGKVVHSSYSADGTQKVVEAKNIVDYVNAGNYTFSIQLQAHGGRAYLSNPYIRIIAKSIE